MTDLGQRLGLDQTLAWQDVYSLDEPDLLALVPRPVHALLLVFPVSDRHRKMREAECESSKDILWIKQTIGNACGLMGLLHSLMNGSARHHIVHDTPLSRLRSTALSLDEAGRAHLIETSTELATAHATAATQGETDAPAAEADIDLHFVSFVKSDDGHLWELDGSQKGPLNCGRLGPDDDLLSQNALCLGPQRFLQAELSDLRFSILALSSLL